MTSKYPAPSAQWAAVITHSSEIREPPQNQASSTNRATWNIRIRIQFTKSSSSPPLSRSRFPFFFSILYALKLVLTSSFLYDFSSKVTNREAVDRSRNLTKPSHNISSFVQYFLFSPILNNSIQFVSILIILYLSGWIIFGLD